MQPLIEVESTIGDAYTSQFSEVAIIDLRFEIEIRAGADRVFALLADLRDYDRWLSRSASFDGTTSISDGPIGVGTTYVEPGPFGTRHGRIVTFEPPALLEFEQPMTAKVKAFGVIGIRLSHTLTRGPSSVRVVRVSGLSPEGPVKFASLSYSDCLKLRTHACSRLSSPRPKANLRRRSRM